MKELDTTYFKSHGAAMKRNTLISITVLIFFCQGKNTAQIHAQSLPPSKKGMAKFEPEHGKCLFFIGQDMGAIGGLNKYDQGYCNYFDMPAGFTTYTSFSPGDESYGYTQRGNDGILKRANWGAGDMCAKCFLDDPDFKHSLVSIGLSLVNHEKEVAKGTRDQLIKDLATWIKGLGERPVFLRIGYEFDGWDWNHYKKKYYLLAWNRIVELFREMEVHNVAFVWQSKGTGTDQATFEEWYPGDDLVDWCGYSYFGNPDEEMLKFARKHQKPVFIAEATPVFEMDNLYFDTQLTNPEIAQRAWEQWFVPFFETINKNEDIIKAFGYINVNWPSQLMWVNNPTFQKVDSRIQASEFVTQKWKEEVSKTKYLKSHPELWNSLSKK